MKNWPKDINIKTQANRMKIRRKSGKKWLAVDKEPHV